MKLTRTFLLVLSAIVATVFADYASVNDVKAQFKKFALKTQTPEDIEIFGKMVKLLSMPSYIFRTEIEEFSQPRKTLTCIVCRASFETIFDMRKSSTSEEDIIDVVIDLCVILNIQDKKVCDGVIKLNIPIILYIIDNQPAALPETFCGLLYQGTTSDECPLNDDRFEFFIDIPKPTRNIVNAVGEQREIKIIQLTDAHIDPKYEPFGVGNCNEPVCCRYGQSQVKQAEMYRYDVITDEQFIAKSLVVKNSEIMMDLNYADQVSMERTENQRRRLLNRNKNIYNQPAGYWGDYRNCDTPIWAMEDAIDHAAENNLNADYVYYTGDTVDHGVWETTPTLCEESISVAVNKIKDAFPNVPIYHILGNHEPQPTNQYAPVSVIRENYTTTWLYNFVADKWSSWLPEESLETIRKGGYYTVVPRPGFRIIALNTNTAYRYNWWLVLNPIDPDGQLQWFADTLFEADKNGEIVHILSHIPPGTHDMYKTWSREYRRIVDTYSHIIAAEFNGHTHNDEFKVYYNTSEPSVPTIVSWNGGAITSYSRYNLNYKVYTIDGNTYEPVDIDTYTYNITEANLTPEQRPRWYKLYSTREAYGLQSLKPQELSNLIQRMATLEERHLLHKYIRYWGKESDAYLASHCNESCELNHLCKMVTTELWDSKKCIQITERYTSENQR